MPVLSKAKCKCNEYSRVNYKMNYVLTAVYYSGIPCITVWHG